MTCTSMLKQIAEKFDPPIRVEMARGRKRASSIGGSKNTGHAWNGGSGTRLPMAGNGGSKLLIFVPQATRSLDFQVFAR